MEERKKHKKGKGSSVSFSRSSNSSNSSNSSRWNTTYHSVTGRQGKHLTDSWWAKGESFHSCFLELLPETYTTIHEYYFYAYSRITHTKTLQKFMWLWPLSYNLEIQYGSKSCQGTMQPLISYRGDRKKRETRKNWAKMLKTILPSLPRAVLITHIISSAP